MDTYRSFFIRQKALEVMATQSYAGQVNSAIEISNERIKARSTGKYAGLLRALKKARK